MIFGNDNHRPAAKFARDEVALPDGAVHAGPAKASQTANVTNRVCMGWGMPVQIRVADTLCQIHLSPLRADLGQRRADEQWD
jgi:hypothetical protein